MIGIGLTELVALLAAFFSGGGLLGLPLSVPPLPPDAVIARATPDACLLHLEAAGLAAPDAAASHPMERMLADDEIRAFLAAAAREIVSVARQSLPLPPEAEDAALILLEAALTRPMALSVERFAPPRAPGAPPAVAATFVLRTGDGEEAIRRALAGLLGPLPPGLARQVPLGASRGQRLETPFGPLSWGFTDGSLLVTVGEGVLESLLERIGDEGRETPEWKADLERRLPVARRSTLLHVDAGALLELLAATMPDARGTRAMFTATGIDGLRSLDAVSGLSDDAFAAEVRLGFEGAPRGIFAPPESGIEARHLARVPADAVRVQSWTLDGKQWLATAMRILEAAGPQGAAPLRGALTQVRAVVGIDLEDDLLGALGPDWTMYDLPAGGGLMPGMAVVAGVRDHDTFAAAHEKLLALVERAGAGADMKPTLARSTYRGRTIHSLAFAGAGMALPITPAWCLLDDRLVLSLSPQLTKALVDGHGGLGMDSVAEVRRDVGEAPADYVGVLDTRAAFRTLCTLYEFLAPMAGGAAAQSGITVRPPELPPLSAASPFLAPAVTVMRHEEDGIRLRGTTTLPVGPLAAVGAGGVSPASTGVLVGLLLPAVQAAREAARRTEATNNFRQILLAMLNYESAMNRMPSQAICDDDGKALLSWRVQILPYLGEEALYRQFHLDEPWDSEHNLALVARMPKVYADPGADPAATAAGLTTFQVFVGEGTPFAEPGKGLKLFGITDGTSNTIAVAEMLPDRAVPWTKPEDLDFDADKPLDGVGNPRRPGGLFLMGMFDGSVRTVDPSIDPDTFGALVTPAGGETIQLP